MATSLGVNAVVVTRVHCTNRNRIVCMSVIATVFLCLGISSSFGAPRRRCFTMYCPEKEVLHDVFTFVYVYINHRLDY